MVNIVNHDEIYSEKGQNLYYNHHKQMINFMVEDILIDLKDPYSMHSLTQTPCFISYMHKCYIYQ